MQAAVRFEGAVQTCAEHAEHRLQAAAAVAAVLHRAVQPLFRAVLADMAVAVEKRVRAEQTEVVHRLHHGNALAECRVIHCRANQRQRVVHMHQRNPVFADAPPNLAVCTDAEKHPQRTADFLRRSHARNFLVPPRIQRRSVTVRFQQVLLVRHNDILAAGNLIIVVYQQYSGLFCRLLHLLSPDGCVPDEFQIRAPVALE